MYDVLLTVNCNIKNQKNDEKNTKKEKKVFELYNGTPVVQYNILWAIPSYILMQYSIVFFFVTNKTKSKADDSVVRVFVSETN